MPLVDGAATPDEGTAARRYRMHRRVRLGDAGPHGRARFDALARYLQDIAGEDGDDSGIGGVWVLRRTVLQLTGSWPRLGDGLALTTFCSGFGSRWAERTTVIAAPRGQVEATAIWVLVDQSSGRPQVLPPAFHAVYGSSAAGRQVTSRLTLPSPPGEGSGTPWQVRYSDLDVLGHVNNARYWEVIEDVLSSRGGPRVTQALLEFRTALEPHHDVEVVTADGTGEAELSVWLRSADGVHAAASLQFA